MQRDRVSVLLPTWRRPTELTRCVTALRSQTVTPAQVVLTVRTDDELTSNALPSLRADGRRPAIDVVMVEPGSLTAAMRAGLGRTTSDLVALTDDDAEPRPDWIERLAAPFADPTVGGVGGRDWQAHERWDAPTVGTLSWYGRAVGNHHVGSGAARDVELLKGVNCCFRGDLLRSIGFDRRLRGRGNVSHWEMPLCFAIRRAGYRLIYDPAIAVDHHVATRHDGDVNARGGFELESYRDSIHNQTLAIAEHLDSRARCTAFAAWSTLVGTREAPGWLQMLRLIAKGGRPQREWQRLRACARGRREGWRTFRS